MFTHSSKIKKNVDVHTISYGYVDMDQIPPFRSCVARRIGNFMIVILDPKIHNERVRYFDSTIFRKVS